MDEKTTTILAGVIIFLGMLLVFHQLQNKKEVDNTRKEAKTSAAANSDSTQDGAAVQTCGQVSTVCTATEEIISENCDQEDAVSELSGRLRNPLSSPGCDNVSEELSNGCLKTCQLDPTSIFVVPGTINYETIFPPIKDGSCTIRARVVATISGSCVSTQ